LEKKGKGCRIFIDVDLPAKSTLIKVSSNIFMPYSNHVDYSAIDLFEWPMVYKDYCFKKSDLFHTNNIKDEIRWILYNNSKIIAALKYSPLFDWNAKSNDGKIHLNATIKYITAITNEIIAKTKQFELLPTDYSLDVNRKSETVKNLEIVYKEIYKI
jgi:hypothetical protein